MENNLNKLIIQEILKQGTSRKAHLLIDFCKENTYFKEVILWC